MSSLNQLRETFDRVVIKYTDNTCEVMLVKGLYVFTGKSRCHGNDNFNKKLGRTIALGRAEFASNVTLNNKATRSSMMKTLSNGETMRCYSTKFCGDTSRVDEAIIKFLPTREEKNAS